MQALFPYATTAAQLLSRSSVPHVAGLGEPLFGAETFLGLFLEPIKANLIQALTYKSEGPSKYDEAKDFQFKLHRTTNFLAEKRSNSFSPGFSFQIHF